MVSLFMSQMSCSNKTAAYILRMMKCSLASSYWDHPTRFSGGPRFFVAGAFPASRNAGNDECR